MATIDEMTDILESLDRFLMACSDVFVEQAEQFTYHEMYAISRLYESCAWHSTAGTIRSRHAAFAEPGDPNYKAPT